MLRFLLLFLIFVFSPFFAVAQNLNNYTPPPMFGAPQTRVTPEEEKPVKKSAPSAKPEKPAKIVKRPPLPTLKPETPREFVQKMRRNMPDIVKGPKTMPAQPPENVDTQTLVKAEQTETILARVQKDERKKKAEEKQRKETLKPDLKNTENPDLIRMNYAQGGSGLDIQKTSLLKEKAVPFILGQARARIQIVSFATAFDTGQSSDRRMALKRALEVRQFLIDEGVEPSRIDVRALGDNAQDNQRDRIDLVFVSS